MANWLKKAFGISVAAADTAAENLDQAIASNFTNVYTKAARNQLEKDKDEFGVKIAQAKTRLKKEQNDVDELEKQIQRIEAQLGNDGNYSKVAYDAASNKAKAIIKKAALALKAELGKLQSRLPREKQEAKDAKMRLDRIQSVYDKLKQQLNSFDQKAQEMKDKLADAENRETDAEMRRKEDEAMANMGTSFGALGTAFDGMNNALEKAEQKAGYAEMQADEAAEVNGSNIDAILAKAEAPEVSDDPWA